MDFIEVTPEFDRVAFLQDFDPHKSTYIVSDLHTKLDIQKILFERFDFLAEDAVLRASELWQRLLLRARPDLQIVSQSLMQSIVGEWLESKKISWAGGAGAAQNLLVSIQQFLPVYLSDEGPELFKEWLGKNENALLRMGQWFFLAYEAWQYLLEKKIVVVGWVPAVLSQLPEIPEWPRELIIDLESNLTGIEGEIFRRMSKERSVSRASLLMPPEKWRDRYFKVLWPYDVLCGRGFQRDEIISQGTGPAENITLHRWTTRMTEGKAVVAQVREWLDAGVGISKIAIQAPDIEEYWPLVSSYFEVEGIPVNKAKVAPLHSFVEISAWLARLRVEAKSLDAADLETSLYNSCRRHEMAFDEFRALFRRIYDFDDLKRHQDLFRLFNSPMTDRSRLRRDEFVSWIIQRWQLADPVENMQLIVARLLDETPPAIEMSLCAWLRYLESIAAKTEKTLALSDEGISFMKVESGFYQNWSHVYFIGLTESAVKGGESSMLTLSDIVRIGQDLGFYLDFPDKPRVECIVDWIASDPKRQAVLSFAATSFSGEPEAPSLYWLSRALNAKMDVEKYSEPGVTRWDELQAAKHLFSPEILRSVDEDSGKEKPAFVRLTEMPSLSASQVERYIQCPFKFTADKVFKLVDSAEVDLDLDHRVRGKVQHALFETLLEEPLQLDRTDAQLEQLIEDLRRREKIIFGDVRLWPSYKARLLHMAQKFLSFEKDWRKQYPNTRTIGREFAFDVGFDATTGEFCSKTDGDFNFRGRIDRVDENHAGEIVLLDYKSSRYDLKNHGAWIKNAQLQLAVYSMIVESGLTSLGERKVAGTFYYVARDFDREIGMRVENAGTDILPPARQGNRLSPQNKESLYAEVRNKLCEVTASMRAGRLQAAPAKPQDCPDCRWRKLCRAPHLN